MNKLDEIRAAVGALEDRYDVPELREDVDQILALIDALPAEDEAHALRVGIELIMGGDWETAEMVSEELQDLLDRVDAIYCQEKGISDDQPKA